MNGDVAQLVRALDWQSRGREFESHLLHKFLLGLISAILCYSRIIRCWKIKTINYRFKFI